MAIASIFNDVLGPVMRGPSSSHSAAACRIGRLLRDLMHGEIRDISIDYDPNGSLVTTHESQGTDMGLCGGLLGWDAQDHRMTEYRRHFAAAGMQMRVNYLDYGAEHPNNYRITISNDHMAHSVTAISTGGGMMSLLAIDGSPVAIDGDYHEVLIFTVDAHTAALSLPKFQFEAIHICEHFIEIKSGKPFSDAQLARFKTLPGAYDVCYLRPVVPVLSRNELDVPYLTCHEMLAHGREYSRSLWELALTYEASRGNITENDVYRMMERILEVMREGIAEGLQGKYYEDRILPVQSPGFQCKMADDALLDGGMLNTIVLFTTAMMEVKSSMGVFVAAPTAGSCGVVPGSLLGAAKHLGSSDEELVRALLSAGIMGVFIAQHSTFAAEVAGCQAETGAGGSMAAAGLVTLAGGTLEQCVAASSLALQNSLGIICDPIGNRVEAPCLGKNVMAASNALSCANMALANYEYLIPFDEVVQSMKEVGDLMAHELTCTGLGGLAATPTGQKILAKLGRKAIYC